MMVKKNTSQIPTNAIEKGELPVFDKTALLAMYGDDRELYLDIIQMYFQDIPPMLQSIKKAIERRNSTALDIKAHELKGAVGSLKAKRAYAAAYRLERLGKEETFHGVSEALAALENELNHLDAVLLDFQTELNSNV